MKKLPTKDRRKEIFNPQDRMLIMSFIKREALDYSGYADGAQEGCILSNAGVEYCKALMDATEKVIRKYGKSFESITFASHGNTGVTIRHLELSPSDPWFDSRGSLKISFCTWSNIIFNIFAYCGNIGCQHGIVKFSVLEEE